MPTQSWIVLAAMTILTLVHSQADKIITLEGDVLQADVASIGSDQQVALKGEGAWPLEKLRAIVPATQAEDVDPAPYTVWLTNGSRFSTRVLQLDEETYHLDNPVLGKLAVPIDLVWGVRLGMANPDSRFARSVRVMEEELIEDIIYVTGTGTTELQEVNGLIEELDQEGLTFDQEGELKVLPAGQVHGVLLASPSFQPESESWITARLSLSDSSLISGNITKMESGEIGIDLGMDLTITLPWAQIRRLTVESDLLHYASDLQPTEAVTEAIYALPRTWKRDLNVRGNPLSLGPERFEKGLGVASGTELTFANDAEYTLFTATIGIDAQRERGDCDFVIRSGKEELYRQRLRSGEPSQFVRIPVKDLAAITLTVEPGLEGLDLADDANWCEACFIQLD